MEKLTRRTMEVLNMLEGDSKWKKSMMLDFIGKVELWEGKEVVIRVLREGLGYLQSIKESINLDTIGTITNALSTAKLFYPHFSPEEKGFVMEFAQYCIESYQEAKSSSKSPTLVASYHNLSLQAVEILLRAALEDGKREFFPLFLEMLDPKYDDVSSLLIREFSHRYGELGEDEKKEVFERIKSLFSQKGLNADSISFFVRAFSCFSSEQRDEVVLFLADNIKNEDAPYYESAARYLFEGLEENKETLLLLSPEQKKKLSNALFSYSQKANLPELAKDKIEKAIKILSQS